MDILKDIRVILVSSAELTDPLCPDLSAFSELSLHCDVILLKSKNESQEKFWVDGETRQGFKKVRFNKVHIFENTLILQTEDFWKTMWEYLSKDYHGISKNQVLHISSNSELSFKTTKNFGFKTCLVPRNSSLGAFDAESIGVDFMASDLFQVHEAIRQSQGKPVYYQVEAKCVHPKIAKEFLKWMRFKHADDLLKVHGCIQYHILQSSSDPSEILNTYVFRSQTYLDQYLSAIAPALREEAKQIFPENLVSFQRRIFHLDNYGESFHYDPPH